MDSCICAEGLRFLEAPRFPRATDARGRPGSSLGRKFRRYCHIGTDRFGYVVRVSNEDTVIGYARVSTDDQGLNGSSQCAQDEPA
jgi:hypothetical protein